MGMRNKNIFKENHPDASQQPRGKATFDERCYQVLQRIPAGKVATYQQIASAIKSPGAARAVGNACRKNPRIPQVPCHRVVCSNGNIGGYILGKAQKKRLLESEGVVVADNGTVRLDIFGWEGPFESL